MKTIDFEIVSEPWATEYKLADGNRVILRVILVKVFDPDGQLNPDGVPAYGLQSQVLARVEKAEDEKVQFKSRDDLKS